MKRLKMKMEQRKKDDTVTLLLEGKLDTLSATELKEVIDNCVKNDTVSLVLDCEALTYISSAGLRTLLTAHKKMQAQKGGLRVIHCNKTVLSVFKMTGFDKILKLD